MRKSKIKQISLAVCMAFMPMVGYTAGLGKLNVNSGLGEPLKVEVELLSVTPDELSTLTAAIASEEAYNVQGITRLGIHSNLKVDIAKNEAGAPILRIRSSVPINDPYLDMLIQVDWASGRLLREYTVLLDPPEYKAATNGVSDFAPVIKPNTSSSVSASSNKATRNTIKSTKKTSNTTNTDEASQPEAGVQQLTTKRGDTLAAIAQKMQVEGVSLDQMLVGLFENNKSAFANGNMNQLKVGQIIKAPSTETLNAIDPKQAKQALKVHASNWNAYRNSLAGNVKAAVSSEDNESKQSASGKIASAEDKSATIKPGVQDVVKLTAGEKSGSQNKAADAAGSDAKVLALQEEAIARENALKESLSRAAALEKQIEDMQKLLALKNQSMTELQKNAELSNQPPVEKPVAETPPAEVAVADPQAAVKVEPPKPEAPKPEAAKPVINAPVPAPAPQPSFLEDLLGGLDIKLLGGGAALAILGGAWLFLRNKRRKELDSFERGILTSGGLRANTVFGNTTGNSSTSDTSFLTDFAQSADGSMIDTNDVDPIAEAEVYMAYGRDAQAEEILKDAIVKEPKRYELHLKLLEMYAARKDVSAFEAVAGELYTTLGADDPTWAKVAELGKKLEPENPLYDVSNVPSSTAALVAGGAAASAGMMAGVMGAAASVTLPAQDAGLDFSLDATDNASFAAENEFQAADEVESKLFGTEPETELSPNAAVMDSFSSAPEDQGLAFDLGLPDIQAAIDSTQAEPAIIERAEQFATVDDNALEFTFGSNDVAEPIGSLSESTVTPAIAEAPGISETPGISEAKDVADNSISFEVPSFLDTAPNIDFSSDSFESNEPAVKNEFSLTDNSSIELSFAEPVAFEIPDTPMPDPLMNVSFDLPSDENQAPGQGGNLLQHQDAAANNTNEQAATESTSEDISFDFSLGDELDTTIADSNDSVPDATNNDFDFSAISLDLGDEANQSSLENIQDGIPEDLSLPVGAESQDVDIKLDLVAAYIDMDDKEGARELLEEVLKEGGPQQKLKAEQLLASL